MQRSASSDSPLSHATHLLRCRCILLRLPQRLLSEPQAALQAVHPLHQRRIVINQLLPVLLKQLACGLRVLHLLHTPRIPGTAQQY